MAVARRSPASAPHHPVATPPARGRRPSLALAAFALVACSATLAGCQEVPPSGTIAIQLVPSGNADTPPRATNPPAPATGPGPAPATVPPRVPAAPQPAAPQPAAPQPVPLNPAPAPRPAAPEPAPAAPPAGNEPTPAGNETGGATTAPDQPVTFRVLTLLYPISDVPGQPRRQLSPQALEAARFAAQVSWPKAIADLTNGVVTVDQTVKVMPALRSNERFRAGGDPKVGLNVWPEDVAGLDDLLGNPGRYDSVLVWSMHDDGASWAAGGGAGSTDAKVTWATVNIENDPTWYGPQSSVIGGTTHEWLHGLDAYYFAEMGLGERAPRCADDNGGTDGLHCAEEYGYQDTQDGLPNWLSWYGDMLNGTIDGHGTRLGLGPVAWAKGVPRDRFAK